MRKKQQERVKNTENTHFHRIGSLIKALHTNGFYIAEQEFKTKCVKINKFKIT